MILCTLSSGSVYYIFFFFEYFFCLFLIVIRNMTYIFSLFLTLFLTWKWVDYFNFYANWKKIVRFERTKNKNEILQLEIIIFSSSNLLYNFITFWKQKFILKNSWMQQQPMRNTKSHQNLIFVQIVKLFIWLTSLAIA